MPKALKNPRITSDAVKGYTVSVTCFRGGVEWLQLTAPPPTVTTKALATPHQYFSTKTLEIPTCENLLVVSLFFYSFSNEVQILPTTKCVNIRAK